MMKRLWVTSIFGLASYVCLGCHQTSPPVRAHITEKWLIVGNHAETFDLENVTKGTLAPLVRKIVGEKVFKNLLFPKTFSHLKNSVYYSLASPAGTYTVCRMLHGGICLVNLSKQKFIVLKSPVAGCLIGGMAWRPNEESLLCHIYKKTRSNQAQGELFLLSKNEDEWLWKRLKVAGKASGEKGVSQVTKGAWETNDTFLFSDAMEIRQFDVKAAELKSIGYGHCVFSLGPGKYLCRKKNTHETPFTMVQFNVGENTPRQEYLLQSNGITMTGSPCVSPNRKYILFLEQYTASLRGNAAIGHDLCIYYIEENRFERLLQGYYTGPVIEIVGGAVWIVTPDKLQKQIAAVE
jgi:hypothetical protein